MYDVKRYPDAIVAQTKYSQRPEGYDRLGSYAGGSNENAERLSFFTPTLMNIRDDADGEREKLMTWPMKFAIPGEALPDPSTLCRTTIQQRTGDLRGQQGPLWQDVCHTPIRRLRLNCMPGHSRELLRTSRLMGLRQWKAERTEGEIIVTIRYLIQSEQEEE